VKLVTNKYLPISQWFTWTDPTIVPTTIPNYADAKTAFGVLYGVELENRLFQSRWFMVGSGAIGCEHLKNLAFMNVGEVILTDPDTIEKSNLNRQFLFRSEHIGKPKSVIAASMIQTIKPGMKITPHLQKVGSDNIEFTNEIMNSNITGVLNALDNIKARNFVDDQCFKFGLALFESGTTGTKGNTQPVIPFVTETYSNSSDPEHEKSFPICTIKSFPNEIAHTIHWAMDQFGFFTRAPATMNKWISEEDYVDSLSQVERVICLDDINQYTIKYPTQQSGLFGCARWAVDMFTESYNNSIIQLLHTFSPTHETSPGVLFWSAGKRCPKPIEFDPTNKLHLDYVEATTHLLARTSGLDDHFTREELCQMIANYKSPPFVPKDIKIAANDSEIEKVVKSEYNVEQVPVGVKTDFKPIYVSQEFEKDDDTNWHIDWVNAASNMRAMNYSIPSVDRQQTKGIAGRIIPAIATTTSAVSGLILIEMLKYLIGFAKVETYRSTFINLAEPILLYSDPISAPQIEVAGVKMNSWTKFEYVNNTTLGEFKCHYENMFKINISIIVIGSSMVYADFLGNVENLDVKLSDIILNTLGSLMSDVTFTLGADDDVDIPAINVKIC
jgi:ubiquitin-activating enzyme E1